MARSRIQLSRRAFVGVAATLAAGASGCAPSKVRPYLAPADASQDTAEITRGVMAGRVGALFYVDRIRGRPGADRITSFSHWGEISEMLGLDPLADIHRAFACAVTSGATDAALVLEHSMNDEQAASALARASGARGNSKVSSATLKLSDTSVVATFPRTGMFVALPTWASARLVEFSEAGGLPNPRGSEVARFFAFRPQDSLARPPEWPPTISAAQAEISFDESGGADVLFQATSTSAEQAEKDAAVMEKTLDDLLHIHLGSWQIPIFDPIHFHPDGSVVRMEAHLLASDVEWILGFGR